MRFRLGYVLLGKYGHIEGKSTTNLLILGGASSRVTNLFVIDGTKILIKNGTSTALSWDDWLGALRPDPYFGGGPPPPLMKVASRFGIYGMAIVRYAKVNLPNLS